MSGPFGLFGNEDSDAAMAALRRNQDLYNNIQTPDLKWQDYNPETFNPDMMTDAQTIQEDPALVSQQKDALMQLSGLAQNGLSEVDQAGYQKARSEAGQIAHSQTDAALQNAQNRGVSGSGMEFAMREMAGQNAANSAQNADLQQAADSAKMRAMYAQAYGSQLAGVRGQDAQVAGTNANILNQFNQANTNTRNQANYGNVQQANQAQQMNNQGRMQTQQQNFNNQITRAGGQAAANTGIAGGYAARDAASTGQWNSAIGTGARLGAAYMSGGASAAGPKGQMAGGSYTDPSGFAAHGGMIPGLPQVPGDSLKNDTVNMHLSPGEIVIPRSHAQTPHLAKAFVEHLFGKK